MSNCGCYRCLSEEFAALHLNGHTIMDMVNSPLNRMIVCETCGNKRCPHATDHRNTCTNSNEPGQKGSRYE